MSRTGKERRRRDEVKLYRIHYECVRRNPDYQESYAKLAEHPGELAPALLGADWGIRRGDQLPDPRERPNLDQSLSADIPEWEVSPRFPVTFPRDHRLEIAMQTASFGLTDAKVERTSMAGTLILGYIPDEDPQHPRVMALDMRWSKKDLMEAFEFWVDWMLADRAVAGLNQVRPKKRLRLNVYEDYLESYDLKTYERRTFAEIARTLWPTAVGDIEKRARDHYRKGRELVLNPPLRPWRPASPTPDGQSKGDSKTQVESTGRTEDSPVLS